MFVSNLVAEDVTSLLLDPDVFGTNPREPFPAHPHLAIVVP